MKLSIFPIVSRFSQKSKYWIHSVPYIQCDSQQLFIYYKGTSLKDGSTYGSTLNATLGAPIYKALLSHEDWYYGVIRFSTGI